MTDEEKKAVKSFKQENENDLSRFKDFNNYTQTLIKRNNIILNLIQKQQAEIEKKDNKIKQYENMILEHKKQLHKSGIYGYDYDLELLESEK